MNCMRSPLVEADIDNSQNFSGDFLSLMIYDLLAELLNCFPKHPHHIYEMFTGIVEAIGSTYELASHRVLIQS
jgi:hypothetical protein